VLFSEQLQMATHLVVESFFWDLNLAPRHWEKDFSELLFLLLENVDFFLFFSF